MVSAWYTKIFLAGFLAVFILFGILSIQPSPAQVTAADIVWDFEAASLDTAITQTVNDVLLRLRADPTPGDLYGWYCFKIAQNAAGQTVNFTIDNPDNWVSENHKPVYSYDGENWARIENVWMHWSTQCFFQNFTADSVYIAQGFPYTYSDLMEELDARSISPCFQYEIIGQSVHNRGIPLVTIDRPDYPQSEKQTCWIISRQHPMESQTSFVISGLMEFLLATQIGAEILQYISFKIVPMVNVDGVAEGISRQNANGINLNRCWAYDTTYAGEEPEVNAVHRAIDQWIAGGGRVDLFLDMHAAPDLYDFGFKLAASYAYLQYWEDVNTFVHHLDRNDPYQSFDRWRDQTQSYGSGLSKMAMYQQHGIPGVSSENSWGRRWNGSPLTIPGLTFEGQFYSKAVFDYLHPLDFTDSLGNRVDTVISGESIHITVCDLDEDWRQTIRDVIYVGLISSAGDSETVFLLETGVSTGLFQSAGGITLIEGTPAPGNGFLEVVPPERITAVYVDDDFPRDSSWTYAWALPSQSVQYHPWMASPTLEISVFPNPFNQMTRIAFNLLRSSYAILSVYDIQGREVARLNDGILQAGAHTMEWQAASAPSGVYFARMVNSGNVVCVRKIILEK